MCKVYGFLISTLNLSFPDYDFRFSTLYSFDR